MVRTIGPNKEYAIVVTTVSPILITLVFKFSTKECTDCFKASNKVFICLLPDLNQFTRLSITSLIKSLINCRMIPLATSFPIRKVSSLRVFKPSCINLSSPFFRCSSRKFSALSSAFSQCLFLSIISISSADLSLFRLLRWAVV